MSHLIIEQGKRVGEEIAVPQAGMKYGRSPANDLVLDDEKVMLFHGRFFFKSDGALWVTDFGAGEKTTVGGNPVDEFQLSIGDLVEVGSIAFRVINCSASRPDEIVPVPVPVAAENSASEPIDLGFKGSKPSYSEPVHKTKESAPKASLMQRLMQVGVCIMAVAVLIIVAPSLMKITKSPQQQVVVKETFSLSYERVKADTENIFRYRFDMSPEGHVLVSIDDLKNKRHIQKDAKVSEALMMQLARSVSDVNFFQVEPKSIGTAEGSHDLYDLTIRRNHRYHQVKVLNREPSLEIKRTVALIEDFALGEVGIPVTFFKDNAELMMLSESSYDLGKERYAERDVRRNYLAQSIKHFKESMFYLETIEPKPNLFNQAEKALGLAVAEQTKRYEDYLFQVTLSQKLGQYQKAQHTLHIMAELILDREDPRYDVINNRLLIIEKHLR